MREILVLLILAAGIAVIVYGCKVYGWYFAELSAVFMEATTIMQTWHRIRKPIPDMAGTSAMAWATPTVKGFIIAPE